MYDLLSARGKMSTIISPRLTLSLQQLWSFLVHSKLILMFSAKVSNLLKFDRVDGRIDKSWHVGQNLFRATEDK